MKQWNLIEWKRHLKNNGCKFHHQKGSRIYYVHPQYGLMDPFDEKLKMVITEKIDKKYNLIY